MVNVSFALNCFFFNFRIDKNAQKQFTVVCVYKDKLFLAVMAMWKQYIKNFNIFMVFIRTFTFLSFCPYIRSPLRHTRQCQISLHFSKKNRIFVFRIFVLENLNVRTVLCKRYPRPKNNFCKLSFWGTKSQKYIIIEIYRVLQNV